MLLQTNSYIVPADRRADHARLIRKFRQALSRIGCDQFEVYEQVGPNWSPGAMREICPESCAFATASINKPCRRLKETIQDRSKSSPNFATLINFPYQQQARLFRRQLLHQRIACWSAPAS